MMARIATEVEAAESITYYGDEVLDGHGAAYAMAKSAAEVAADLDSSSIVVYTLSGRTARTLSRLRPRRPILALCPEASVCRRLMLYHGVFPLEIGFGASTDMMLEKGDRLLLARGLVEPGERVVVLGGTTTVPGATNLLQIRRIGNTGD